MKAHCYLAAALLSAGLLQAGVGGVVAGYAVDSRTDTLRPLYGIPGAQTFGDPVASGVRKFVPSPDGQFALIVALDGSLSITPQLRSGWSEPIASGYAVSGDALAISGQHAAFFDSTGVTVLAGLPEHASPIARWELPTSSAGRSIAIDAGRKELVVAVEGGVYRRSWDPQGEWTLVQQIPSAGSLEIVPGGKDLLVMDRAWPAVWLIRDYATAPTGSMLATATDGVSEASVLTSIGTAGRIAVTTGASLLLLDPAQPSAARKLALPVPATRLERLAPDALALTVVDGNPLYVLDASATPEVYFVPGN